jgi:hypothetical protein
MQAQTMSEAKKDMYKTPETADGGLLNDILVKVMITSGKRKRADEKGAAGDGQETEKSGNVRWTQEEREMRGIQQPQSLGQSSFLKLCKELNISPVKTCDGLLPEVDEVLLRIKKDGFSEQYASDAEAKKFLAFLYGREFKRDDPESARIKAINQLITPSSDPNAHGPYERLQRIIQVDSDNDLHDLGGNVESYCREWGNIVRIWGNSAHAITIFNCAKVTIVHRRQLASNCFLQAAAAGHKYLVQKGSGEDKGMLDLAKYVRNKFDSLDLEKYLLTDLGGDTLHFFTLLADLKHSEVIRVLSKNIQADLLVDVTEPSLEKGKVPACWKRLVDFGPAVVTKFFIAEDFRGYKQPSDDNFVLPQFSEPVTPTLDGGRHAMLLVGMRYSSDDMKWHLLLQNWWDHMQFVDVTAEYLHSTGAELIFCKKSLENHPPHTPTLASKYAETSVDGADVFRVGNLDVKN